MAGILIAPGVIDSEDRITSAGQRDASGGHLGNAPASAQGRRDSRNPEKGVVVEDGVEPGSPNPTVVPQRSCMLSNTGSSNVGLSGCALPGHARRDEPAGSPDSVFTCCPHVFFALILIF